MGIGKKKPKEEKTTTQKSPGDGPHGQLRDFSVIKDWFDYSINRTMAGLKLTNAADIKAAEMERDAKKAGRDWNSIVMVVAILIVVSVVGFMMIMQFGNVTQVNDDLASCKGSRAELQGTLKVCQDQLDKYEPEIHEVKPEINI